VPISDEPVREWWWWKGTTWSFSFALFDLPDKPFIGRGGWHEGWHEGPRPSCPLVGCRVCRGGCYATAKRAHYASTKPEVHNTSQCRLQATGNIRRELGEVWTSGFWDMFEDCQIRWSQTSHPLYRWQSNYDRSTWAYTCLIPTNL